MAATEFFVRANASYADYQADAFASKTGPTLEAGALIGSSSRHAVGVEFARFPWEMDATFPSLLAPGSSLGTTGSGHLAPLLASYRYYFQKPDARWRFFLGVAAGATQISGRIDTRLSGTASGGEVKGWANTAAGTAGLALAITRNVALELSCRYLQTEEIDYVSYGFAGSLGFVGPASPPTPFAASKLRVASLGLSIKF